MLTDEPFSRSTRLLNIYPKCGIDTCFEDFILDEYQVYEARVAGADAVLLIAECLEGSELEDLYSLIRSLGMTPLIELYEPRHLQRILDTGTKLVRSTIETCTLSRSIWSMSFD